MTEDELLLLIETDLITPTTLYTIAHSHQDKDRVISKLITRFASGTVFLRYCTKIGPLTVNAIFESSSLNSIMSYKNKNLIIRSIGEEEYINLIAIKKLTQ